MIKSMAGKVLIYFLRVFVSFLKVVVVPDITMDLIQSKDDNITCIGNKMDLKILISVKGITVPIRHLHIESSLWPFHVILGKVCGGLRSRTESQCVSVYQLIYHVIDIDTHSSRVRDLNDPLLKKFITPVSLENPGILMLQITLSRFTSVLTYTVLVFQVTGSVAFT